jgi:hypothetical protein
MVDAGKPKPKCLYQFNKKNKRKLCKELRLIKKAGYCGIVY